jgi:enamine deaminase RidA (YjgF/YER057c/UK114 family)
LNQLAGIWSQEELMEISRYNPEALGAPMGQYSHVTRVKTGELLFIAGQLHFGSDLQSQCDGIFASIGAALRSSQAEWANVAQFTTYLVDASLIPEFMKWRLANFPGMFGSTGYPPNTLLVIDRLVHPDFLIEVQTIAAL